MKKPTYAELQRKIAELEAQMAHRQRAALRELPKTSTERGMGSALILRINWLGGRSPCEPFAIRDGLSEETISALQADIRRSMELSGYKEEGV